MQDNEVLKRITSYTLVNEEMADLLERYRAESGIDDVYPVRAMYNLAKFLKAKQIEVEDDVKEVVDEIYIKAGRDPILFEQAHQQADRAMYEALKPIIQDYMTARIYYVMAMNRSQEEYEAYLAKRDEQFKAKTK